MDVPEVTRKSRVAKVSSANLPQELALAKFVQDVKNPHPSWKSTTPACEWAYVKCNERGEVSELDWKKSLNFEQPTLLTQLEKYVEGMEFFSKSESTFLGIEKLEGTLHLVHLPRTLQILDVSFPQSLGYSGVVPWNYLPSNLNVFLLSGNHFSGSVDLTSLPPSLRRVGLNQNKFTGHVSLSTLPAGLEDLYLDWNSLTGSLDLTLLPPKMRRLGLAHNKFTGVVSLSTLPEGLEELHLDRNSLTGTPDLTSLPNSLTHLHLRFNMFSGVVDLSHFPASLKNLQLGNNSELRGTGKRSELPMFTYVDNTQIVVTM